MHPSEESLIRYGMGEITPGEKQDLESHVDTCAQCREQVKQIVTIHRGLSLIAHRPRKRTTPCLDAAELASYLDGTAQTGVRESVEQHLVECEDCFRALILAKTTVPQPAPEAL